MSRPKATLGELMGSKAGVAKTRGLSLEDLPELLGERMPKLEYNAVGRMRLTNALRNRFGDNFRQLQGIDEVLKEFDEEVKFGIKKAEMKMIGRRK